MPDVNQRLAEKMLEKLGHEAICVSDGRQAIERLGRGDIDLVLMDVQMPVLDGLAATREIRALDGEIARVTIVAMTASAMGGDRERCLKAGMDDFLAKPMRLQDLREKIEEVCGPRPATT